MRLENSTQVISRSPAISLAIRGLIAFHMMLVFAFRPFEMPSGGLDASWGMVLIEAAAKEWQWGKDVIYSFGPFGYLYWNIFDERLFGRILIFNILIGAAATAAVIALLRNLPPFLTIGIYAAIVVGGNVGLFLDPFYMAIPLLVVFGHYCQPKPVPRAVLVAITAAMGLVALIKLSFAVSALGMFVLLDLDRVSRRLWAMYLPVFLGSSLTFYLAASQSIAALPQFLIASKEVISGYTDAMATTGSLKELLAFCGISAVMLGLVVWNEHILGLETLRKLRSVIVPTAFLLAFVLAIKAGFVRHDAHALNAWGCLTVTLAAYMASAWPNIKRRARLGTAFCILLLTLGALTARSRSNYFRESVGADYISTLWTVPKQHLRFGGKLAHFSAMRQDLIHRREIALAEIKEQQPLPNVADTVDVIPSMQSSVVAHKFDYRPRPSFQDYNTYTDGLIDVNVRYLRGPDATANILFGFFPIDGRIPTLSDGALWPELLQNYDAVLLQGSTVLLSHRAVPRSKILGDAIEADSLFDTEVPVPSDVGAVFVEVDIRPNLLGTFADLSFKKPSLYMTFSFSSGRTETYRIIPNMARRGFVISPLVDNVADFFAFAQGSLEQSESNRRVVSLRLDSDSLSRWFYAPTFRIKFHAITG